MVFVLFFMVFIAGCEKPQSKPQKPNAPISAVNSEYQQYKADEVSNSSTGVVVGGNFITNPKPKCGNGKLDSKENCDDGNRKNGDGCSFDCKYEFPQCRWLCDDPICNISCDPVCEPPRCHTACEELINPSNCLCDVKCEKPECEIKCSDPECELQSCPACITVCKIPHCVTHCQQIDPNGPSCQAPRPNCNALCGEATCAYKCHQSECPKPQCELMCEEPAPVCQEN